MGLIYLAYNQFYVYYINKNSFLSHYLRIFYNKFNNSALKNIADFYYYVIFCSVFIENTLKILNIVNS